MPVKVEPIENGHILTIVPSEPWDILDVGQAQEIIKAHIDGVDFTVHNLLDLRYIHRPPTHLIGGHGLSMLHYPRRGYMAIFGASSLIRSMCNVLFRMQRFRLYRIFASEQQARDFLHSVIAAENDTGPLKQSGT